MLKMFKFISSRFPFSSSFPKQIRSKSSAMCITFVCTDALRRGLNYKLILLNNRDEVLDRKTSATHWEGGYLAGRDEQATERGTWLGMSRDGRIGNLLSITEPELDKKRMSNAPSRGSISSDFLTSGLPAADFCDRLNENAYRYHGFQFLALEKKADDKFELISLTNRLVHDVRPRRWPPGVYVFGNSPRELPMKKVVYGEREFNRLVDHDLTPKTTETEIVNRLLKLARDPIEHFPDPQIAVQTGRDESYNRCLSSIFVRFPPSIRYGTRSHSIVLVDVQNRVFFREERMVEVPEDPTKARWEVTEERFVLT